MAIGKGSTSKLVWDISELNKINKFLAQLKVRGIQAMRSELNRISKDIVKGAKINAPFLSGRLRKSGRVIKPKANATQTKFAFQVIFGGISITKDPDGKGPAGSKFVGYAQDVEIGHKTKSRYLERAFNEMIPKMEGRIITSVKKHFKKGFKL